MFFFLKADSDFYVLAELLKDYIGLIQAVKVSMNFSAQLFEGRLVLNPALNLTQVYFSFVQKHFLG